jgi:predicted transcriptional regulator
MVEINVIEHGRYECGFFAQTLHQHLRVALGLAAADHRTRWKLAAGYPFTAPAYSARRSRLAKEVGLARAAPSRAHRQRSGRGRDGGGRRHPSKMS